jgi:hypothetical protein
MTYRQLLERLQNLDSEQLDMDVTVLDMNFGEFLPIQSFHIEHNLLVLDDNHPYLKT